MIINKLITKCMEGDRKYPEVQTNWNEEPEIDPDLFSKKPVYTTMKDTNNKTSESKTDEIKVENSDGSGGYRWLKIVGQGTFGIVYKAEETATKKIYAIKKVFQDPKYTNREFKIVIDLDHPNCIKVHRYFFSQKDDNKKDIYLNLVMDFIPDTLYKILRFYCKKNIEFPNALGKIYSYQMLRALAYIHNLSICHRDIKPQNILINLQDHKLVLCDFGSAKILKSGETSVSYICSRYYRAPELILGEEAYTTAIDIWSIGCVIAEMFLGEPLFCGKNSKDQFFKIMQVLGTPTPEEIQNMCSNVTANLPEMKGIGLKKKLKNADPNLLNLLSKTLAYDPKKRMKPFELLFHPYFDDLRSQRVTINGRNVIDLFNFNKIESKNHEGALKDLIPLWYKA